jgi:16S rRNA (adenine1518-N6/adenine1519-N6)-dimethyltransferase
LRTRGRAAQANVTAEVRLLGAGDVRAIARRLDVQPTKKLGQNFVVQPGTVRQIAAIAGPFEADDVILEVGPGLGSLTLALVEASAQAGARVVAVEIDPVLAAELPKTIAGRAPAHADRVAVVTANALRIGPADIENPTVIAANLPYNVAVPVVLHLLASFPSIGRGLRGTPLPGPPGRCRAVSSGQCPTWTPSSSRLPGTSLLSCQ